MLQIPTQTNLLRQATQHAQTKCVDAYHKNDITSLPFNICCSVTTEFNIEL